KAPVEVARPVMPPAGNVQSNPLPLSPPTPVEPPAPPKPEAQIISKPKKLVSLDVIVQDKAGRTVSDLVQNDFTVFESGTKQELAGFAYERTPVSVVLLLDVSGSISGKLK